MSRFLWTLLISTVFVIGCSPDEDQEKETEEESTWIVTPSNLAIYKEDETHSFPAKLDKFCWEQEGESCSLTPNDPREIIDNQSPSKPLFATPGEHLSFQYFNGTDELPYPNEITFTQFSKDEDDGKEVDIFLDEYNQEVGATQEIQAPEEPGKYYYLVHMEWTEELIGEAYYAFYFFVKEEES